MLNIKNLWDNARLSFRMVCNIFGVSRPLDFVEFLSSPDRGIRWDAADWLSGIGDKSVIKPVFEVLQHEPDMMVAKKLIWTLERGKAWDEIFLLLDFPKKYIRGCAASALSNSAQIRFVVPLLERMNEYETTDHSYYFDCWLALCGIVDQNSVEPILNLLSRTSSSAMKGDLLHLLGYTKTPQIYDLLIAEIDNTDEEIRSKVVSGLVALGKEDTRVLHTLRKLLTDPSKQIRTQARVAIEYWEKLATAEK